MEPIRRMTEIEERLDAIDMYPAEYKDKFVLFDDRRIKLPENSGLYEYGIRYSDDDDSIPAELSSWILVNFYGTIISDSEIELPNKDPKFKDWDDMTEDDLYVYWDDRVTLLDLLINKQNIINMIEEYY